MYPTASVPVPVSFGLSELLGALSHALDMTEGQPEGHCTRCAWIGMHIGQEIGLSEAELADLFYTLLLKDLGCSSNAARICELYLTDDIGFKRHFKAVGPGLPSVLGFVLSHTGLEARLADRFRALGDIVRNGGRISRELIETRCQRGAAISRRLRFSDAVADGIASLDEHWDGGGKPVGIAGAAIPLFARIALIAQVVDVFHVSGGARAAVAEVARRSGRWFDPALVAAFRAVAARPWFWDALADPDLAHEILALEPAQHRRAIDEDYLDDIAAAFADVVDSKSPFTSGHSTRVALFTDMIAEAMDVGTERRRWLRRCALLHDVGKLGVSNSILDKPGRLDAAEWQAMRMHPAHSEAILSRIGAFGELAVVAGAHHERLDGKGYPRGIAAEAIALETRIITTADIYDALTAERPYRPAMPEPKVMAIMTESLGTAIDPACFEALRAALAKLEAFDPRWSPAEAAPPLAAPVDPIRTAAA